jgi:hypothetical protein
LKTKITIFSRNKNNYFSLKTKITVLSLKKKITTIFQYSGETKKNIFHKIFALLLCLLKDLTAKTVQNICAITLFTERFDSKNSSKYLRYYLVLTE